MKCVVRGGAAAGCAFALGRVTPLGDSDSDGDSGFPLSPSNRSGESRGVASTGLGVDAEGAAIGLGTF